MRITANREGLYRAFQRLGGVVSSSLQQPLFSHVRLEAAENEAILFGTDLEVGLSLKVQDVQTEQEGVVLLRHDKVSQVLGATPDEQVTVFDQDGAIVIETERSRFRILAEDPADFPLVPQLPDDGLVEIDADVLKYMIRRTVFATAEEKGRYALHGVLWIIGKDGTIEMVAADGARLAHVKKKASNPDGIEAEFIAMRAGMEQLARLADYGKDPVRVATAEGRLLAANDAGCFACQLVEGQFPNFREVIPTECKFSVQLPAQELLSAVRRAGFMTTEETRVVDFAFSSDGLTITAESPDLGRAEVRVALEYDGEAAEIAFNPEFLEQMLSIVERDVVKMRFNDRRSPCVLKSGLDYTYVVSPVVREEAEL